MLSFKDEELRSQLEKHEGRRSRVYQDSLGIWTAGVGRNMESVGLSQDEIDLMLDNDLKKNIGEIELYFPWVGKFSAPRQRVYIDMCFMGIKKFRNFKKMHLAAASGDFEKAADEMLDSLWAKQVGDRALFLSAMMRTG